jgi:hypothetical protein
VPGAAEVIRPRLRELAGAVGAAIAPVGARAERISSDRPAGRAAARSAALESAIHAGADPGAVQIVAVDEFPLGYLAEPAVRIRVDAAGPPA